MKVALCLSGQPRNVERGYEYIKENVLDILNPDVYVHTWWNPEITGKQFVNAGGHVASDEVPEDIPMVIERLYKPKLLSAVPQIQFDEKNYNERKYPGIKPFNSLSQRYSVRAANGLRKMLHKEYDAIIRMRFDWAITTPIYLDDLDLNYLYYPGDCPHPGGINDQFAIANPKNMDIYCSLYDHIEEYYNSGVIFCDEILLGHHLKVNNVPMRTYRVGYGLMRGDKIDMGRAV